MGRWVAQNTKNREGNPSRFFLCPSRMSGNQEEAAL